ncbi:MAG TPA: ATP-dependent helicase [Chloroflexota bacterium]|nr:ATP-dependent helicase [Chloroflexota bacterium]
MFASVADWKQSLNPAQLEAVTCGDGPVLVIAGAGTGKTWTLACRVAYLIEQGVPPERILLLTFSRRAAREMLSRAGRLVDIKRAGKVWGGTFHAIANRLLRQYGRPLGLAPDFTVLDQADMADLLDLIRSEQQSARDKREQRRFPRKDTLVAIYSRMVNAGQGLSTVLENSFPWCIDDADGIRTIFAEYTRRKRAQNVLDYDDLLLFWRALGATPSADQLSGQFEHVLVDEYQDTNPLQAQILQTLRHNNRNLMVVGDDAQAIYAFRGASIRNILDFPQQFPGARRVTLEQNYRSTRPILDVSNAVIAHARERFPKDLWPVRSGGARPVLLTCADESEQSLQVCAQVLEHREQGTPLRQQVVLFRTGHHSDLLELELTRRNIPFVKFGGLKFLESAHIKDVLAVLRLLENPRDEVSWFRVLQLLDGIGPASARAILQTLGLRTSPDCPPPRRSLPAPDDSLRQMALTQPDLEEVQVSPIVRLIASPPRVPEAARESLERLRDTFADCLASGGTLPPAAEIARIRRFCEPIFQQRYSSPQARLHDIDQLEQVAGAHASRGRFLSELALDPPTSTSDLAGPPLLDEDYLILSTVHSAKGGEWDVVHVIHAADGMIPSDMSTGDQEAIEEERRLFYVALTRARDNLYVYFALRFYRRPRGLDDAHHFAQLTRFLPDHVQSLFERQTAGEVSTPTAPTGSGNGARDGVTALLTALWDA